LVSWWAGGQQPGRLVCGGPVARRAVWRPGWLAGCVLDVLGGGGLVGWIVVVWQAFRVGWRPSGLASSGLVVLWACMVVVCWACGAEAQWMAVAWGPTCSFSVL
jgi:hypothetical protein